MCHSQKDKQDVDNPNDTMCNIVIKCSLTLSGHTADLEGWRDLIKRPKVIRRHQVELVDPESRGKSEPLSNPEVDQKTNRTTLKLIVSRVSSLLVENTKLHVMFLYAEHKSATQSQTLV